MTRRLRLEADGGSRGNPGPAGFGAVLRDADTGEVVAERNGYLGVVSNNVAEYAGLIAGLEAAVELGGTDVEVRMDSKLVVEQMSGRWQVKHPSMKPLAAQAAALVRQLSSVSFRWIPREANRDADRLANLAMDARASTDPVPAGIDPTGSEPNPDGAAGLAAEGPNRLSGWMAAATPPITTLLLRHGETTMSVERRFAGSSDPPLTETGRGQAAMAAVALAGQPVTALVVSPMLRCRETADPIGAALGILAVVDDDVRETDFGAWEGLTFAEVQRRWPDELQRWLDDEHVAPPGGESFAATTARVRAARDRWVVDHPGGLVVVVSHVTPIKVLVRLALGAPPSALYRLHLDVCALSTVDWFADGAAVVRGFNDTHHLNRSPTAPARSSGAGAGRGPGRVGRTGPG